MSRKVLSYLGFAKKSRNLLTGYNTCEMGLAKRKVKLLLLAEGLAENTVKKFTQLTKKHGVPMIIWGSKEELSRCTGEQDKGVYGITDQNFADVIMKELDLMLSEGGASYDEKGL